MAGDSFQNRLEALRGRQPIELSIKGDNFFTGKPYRGSMLVTTSDTLLDVKLRLHQATGVPLFAMKLRAGGVHDLWGYFEDTANVHERVQAYMERYAHEGYTPLLDFAPFAYDLCLDRHVSAVCLSSAKNARHDSPIDLSQRRCLHAGSDTIRLLPVVSAIQVQRLVVELQALGGPSTRFMLPTDASAATFLTLVRRVRHNKLEPLALDMDAKTLVYTSQGRACVTAQVGSNGRMGAGLYEVSLNRDRSMRIASDPSYVFAHSLDYAFVVPTPDATCRLCLQRVRSSSDAAVPVMVAACAQCCEWVHAHCVQELCEGASNCPAMLCPNCHKTGCWL